MNITGYKVIADENANPGRYGFRIVHDTHKPHFFSSEEQVVVREWMKALMKATIARNFNGMLTVLLSLSSLILWYHRPCSLILQCSNDPSGNCSTNEPCAASAVAQ